MRDDHIIGILEENRVGNLSQSELSVIEAHVKNCSKCLQAYKAAQISGAMLKARASETVEPSPFFQTRVIAALKEKQLAPEPSPLFRLWKAAGVLVSSMIVMVVILLTLTFFISSHTQTESTDLAADQSAYSTDRLLFDDSSLSADDNMSNSQVLTAVFDSEDTYGNN